MSKLNKSVIFNIENIFIFIMKTMNSYENLKEWIIKNGGYIHPGIGIDESCPENRILIANQKIENNELIFKIPKHLCIQEEVDLSINELFIISAKNIRKIISLHREFELGEKSLHYPYLSMLQDLKSYQSHPYYQIKYHPEKSTEWEKICNFSKICNIRVLKNKMTKLFFEKIHKLPLTDEQILYYELLIMTRVWDNIGFVPFADLFQSTQDSKMFLLENDEKTHYQLTVDRTYEPNQTIWINYGIFDETILYTNFGFIDDIDEKRNLSRTLRVTIPNLPTNLPETKLNKFKEEKLSTLPKNEIYFSSKGISNSLLAHLRVLNLSEKDFLFLENNKDFKTIVSMENEMHVLKSVLSLLFSQIFPSKEMVQESKRIISEGVKNSTSYHLAKITMYQRDIFNFVFHLTLKGILGIFNLPNDFEIKFNHHLLD
jgi:hypothetical protein